VKHQTRAWEGAGLAGDNHASVLDRTLSYEPPHSPSSSSRLTATLIPPVPRTGGRYAGVYAVEFNGERIVDRSRDPECDAARALLTRGITGKIKIIDAGTGKHRSIVNIEKASRLCVREGAHAPYFRVWRLSERSPAAEDGEAEL
jgi:hypothetical protein